RAVENVPLLALLDHPAAAIALRLRPGVLHRRPVRETAPVEQPPDAIPPGDPRRHAIVEQRVVDLPPGRRLPLTQRRVGPDRLSERLTPSGRFLPEQAEQRAPDVHRPIEIA